MRSLQHRGERSLARILITDVADVMQRDLTLGLGRRLDDLRQLEHGRAWLTAARQESHDEECELTFLELVQRSGGIRSGFAGRLPRNYLLPCLLLLAEGSSHGYELLKQSGRLGLEPADPAGSTGSLRGMKQEELVSSWWEHSQAGPPRRTYALTEEGLAWLHAWPDSRLPVAHRLLGN